MGNKSLLWSICGWAAVFCFLAAAGLLIVASGDFKGSPLFLLAGFLELAALFFGLLWGIGTLIYHSRKHGAEWHERTIQRVGSDTRMVSRSH